MESPKIAIMELYSRYESTETPRQGLRSWTGTRCDLLSVVNCRARRQSDDRAGTKAPVPLDDLLKRVSKNEHPCSVDTGPRSGGSLLMAAPYCPRRGDIVWLSFDPQAG